MPVGGYEDGPRAFCRASPMRASRSRPNPPSISLPPVVLTSYRSTAERKLLPPLKAPKPTWVRQDIAISGDPPKPDLDLPLEDGIQTGTGPRVVGLWVGKGRGGGREVEKPTTYNGAGGSLFLHQLLPWAALGYGLCWGWSWEFWAGDPGGLFSSLRALSLSPGDNPDEAPPSAPPAPVEGRYQTPTALLLPQSRRSFRPRSKPPSPTLSL